FYTDAPLPGIYTLSLHDALPISEPSDMPSSVTLLAVGRWPATEKPAVLVSPPPIASTPGASVATVFRSDASVGSRATSSRLQPRSEEHTSELQSRSDLVCRLLLE